MKAKQNHGEVSQAPTFSRRRFIKRFGTGIAGMAALSVASPVMLTACGGGSSSSQGTSQLFAGTSIRSLSNPYHADWKRGADAFVKTLKDDPTHRVLLSEGDSSKQINDTRAFLSQAGNGNAIFNFDPNEAVTATPLVEACERAQCYFVTNWNKPDDLHPWDYKYWVSHMAADDIEMGRSVGEALAESMGGQGKMVGILGLLGNIPSQNRLKGLENALENYPDIELVQTQNADWDRTKAQDVAGALLAAHPDATGVWAADDNMALGALEVLRSRDLTDKVGLVGIAGVKEAVEAIEEGTMLATAGIDAVWQGGIGLSIALHAKRGEINPADEPRSHREFYFDTTLVEENNAADWLKKMSGNANRDWNDLWGNVLGPIRY